MEKKIKKTKRENLEVNGFMVLGEFDNKMHLADFVCCEDVEVAPFSGNCKVQMMHDGNMYITELPKRVKNKPLMRQTHSAFSLGKDKRYYFIFSLPAEELHILPALLIKEAKEIVKFLQKEVKLIMN